MPQLIQRAPLGLLGALDSKAGGQNPNTLSDIVQPTIDLRDLYTISERFSVNSTTLLAGGVVIGFNQYAPTLSGPRFGELWLVRQATCFATAVYAAATFRFALAITDIRNNSINLIGPTVGGAVGERPITGGLLGYLLRPGESFGLWAANPAGAVDTQLSVLYDLIRT